MATHEFTIRAKVGEYSRYHKNNCYTYPIPPQEPCYPTIWAVEDGDDTSGVLISGQYRNDYYGGEWQTYEIDRSFVWFETDDIIVGSPIATAVLTLKRVGIEIDKNDSTFSLFIQRGISLDDDGNPVVPHYPSINSDYNKANVSGDGGSIAAADIGAADTYFDIPLNEDGRDWVITGNLAITKLCIRSSDDISGTAPSSGVSHRVGMYSASSPTLISDRPLLTVNVTLSIPTMSTEDATDITTESATLNGTVTHTGYWTQSWGFEYKEGVGGDVSSVTVSAVGTAGVSTFSFNRSIGGLLAGTLYYYRSWGNNDAGKGYGSWVAFTTESAEPVVTTQAASVPVAVVNPAYCEWATGNGTIVSGNEITDRGFEIVVQFSGDLYDSIMHSMAGFEGTTSWDFDTFKYVGTLTKTETEDIGFGGYFGTGAYTLELGAFPAFFYDKLFAGESYTYRAFATNDIGTGYGDWVEFSLGVYEGEGSPSPTDDISDGDPCVPIIPIDDPSTGDDIGIGQTDPTDLYPPFVWTPPDLLPYPPWDWSYPPWDYDLPELPPWVNPDFPDLPTMPPWVLPDLPPWIWWEFPDLPELPPWVNPDFPDLPELPPWIWWYFPDLPTLPPWYFPDLPEVEIPDYPPMSFVGEFYYHKPYNKKDLNELRQKCIIYNKNSVEFALVLRHNMNVLKEFFNMMTDYLDSDEYNDFTDLIPPQNLKELSLDNLEVNDFKDMINGFIRNTVDNNMAVNRNFGLIQSGLSDYETGSEDAYFNDIYSNMKTVTEDNPDVATLKRVVDNLNQEVADNFDVIMKNLQVVRARLL